MPRRRLDPYRCVNEIQSFKRFVNLILAATDTMWIYSGLLRKAHLSSGSADLAPLANGLSVFANSRGDASEWQLHFGPLTFHLTISAEVWRGFSGEGQVLAELAAKERDRLLSVTPPEWLTTILWHRYC